MSQAALEEAFQFALKSHQNQVRMDGTPYIAHPVAVCGLVASFGGSPEAQVAALLHDVLEDCPEWVIGYQDLVYYDGDHLPGVSKLDVDCMVRDLTKPDFPKCDRNSKNRCAIDKVLYSQVSETLLVKMCDRIHNLWSPFKMGGNFPTLYLAESVDMYNAFLNPSIRLGFDRPRMVLKEAVLRAYKEIYPNWRIIDRDPPMYNLRRDKRQF